MLKQTRFAAPIIVGFDFIYLFQFCEENTRGEIIMWVQTFPFLNPFRANLFSNCLLLSLLLQPNHAV
jgi:hypothetical protein